jgi:Flp pilus assembly protein TadD
MVKADCLRANNEFKEAEKAYDLAIGCEKVDPSMIYLKKIQMEIEQIQYGQASKDIEKLLQLQPSNSETLSYKGIVQKQQGTIGT